MSGRIGAESAVGWVEVQLWKLGRFKEHPVVFYCKMLEYLEREQQLWN